MPSRFIVLKKYALKVLMRLDSDRTVLNGIQSYVFCNYWQYQSLR